jgi:hypothetical protein
MDQKDDLLKPAAALVITLVTSGRLPLSASKSCFQVDISLP